MALLPIEQPEEPGTRRITNPPNLGPRAQTAPFRAILGGPVPVSIHGMRTFDADVGSRLQGLFLTDGFCTAPLAEGDCGR